MGILPIRRYWSALLALPIRADCFIWTDWRSAWHFGGDMAYKTAPNIDLQRVDDQMMVLDLTHNAYFSLNETASFLVQKLLEGRTCQDAVLDALEVFDGVTQEILSKDFADTLNELLKLGILIEQDK